MCQFNVWIFFVDFVDDFVLQDGGLQNVGFIDGSYFVMMFVGGFKSDVCDMFDFKVVIYFGIKGFFMLIVVFVVFWLVEVDVVGQFVYVENVEVVSSDVGVQWVEFFQFLIQFGWVQVVEQFKVFMQWQQCVMFWLFCWWQVFLFWIVDGVEQDCICLFVFGDGCLWQGSFLMVDGCFVNVILVGGNVYGKMLVYGFQYFYCLVYYFWVNVIIW